MKFIEYVQDQSWLFPPSLRELIKGNDLCVLINDVVERIGVREIEGKYVEEGPPAYHPKMMVKIYFYAYALGIRSSRKIARELEANVKFWYLSSRQTPDFRTISDFRKNHIEEIKLSFKKVIRLSLELGMVNLGLVAIDGTKVKAAASDKQTKTEEELKKGLKKIEEDISKFLEEAEETDLEEDKKYGVDKRGDEVPKDLAKAKDRKDKIEEALKKLETNNLKKINVTDNDAKTMKGKRKFYEPAYNCQTAVDEKRKVIIAAEAFSEAGDVNLLPKVTEAAIDNSGSKPEKVVSDCGYHSTENIEYLESKEIDGYIPDTTIKKIKEAENKTKVKTFNKEDFYYGPDQDCYICPERKRLNFWKLTKIKGKDKAKRSYRASGKDCRGCKYFGICTKSKQGRTIERDGKEEIRRKMAEKIRSPEGMAIYGKRMHVAEMPFGNIKQNLGFREFLLRGLAKVDGEFKLICTVHNIKMIYSFVLEKRKETGPPKQGSSNGLNHQKEKNQKKIRRVLEKILN